MEWGNKQQLIRSIFSEGGGGGGFVGGNIWSDSDLQQWTKAKTIYQVSSTF